MAKEPLAEGWDQQKDKFINLAPDFVIEIRSKNDIGIRVEF
ncbi:MAG: hypothetical protein V7K30_31515 [Nostoc sp.]